MITKIDREKFVNNILLKLEMCNYGFQLDDNNFTMNGYSMMEAKKWLENDTDISTNLGIASHYITDSYAAPHNIFGEKPFQHAAFEKQVSKYYPKVSCKDYNLKIEELDGALTTSKDWSIWLKTKNIKIPKNEVKKE